MKLLRILGLITYYVLMLPIYLCALFAALLTYGLCLIVVEFIECSVACYDFIKQIWEREVEV